MGASAGIDSCELIFLVPETMGMHYCNCDTDFTEISIKSIYNPIKSLQKSGVTFIFQAHKLSQKLMHTSNIFKKCINFHKMCVLMLNFL